MAGPFFFLLSFSPGDFWFVAAASKFFLCVLIFYVCFEVACPDWFHSLDYSKQPEIRKIMDTKMRRRKLQNVLMDKCQKNRDEVDELIKWYSANVTFKNTIV